MTEKTSREIIDTIFRRSRTPMEYATIQERAGSAGLTNTHSVRAVLFNGKKAARYVKNEDGTWEGGEGLE